MAEYAVGDAVQVGTAADARHGTVAALVTEPDGAQSYDVTMADNGAAVRVREGDLVPFVGGQAQPVASSETPAQLVAEAATLVQEAESEVKQDNNG